MIALPMHLHNYSLMIIDIYYKKKCKMLKRPVFFMILFKYPGILCALLYIILHLSTYYVNYGFEYYHY